jgi:UPF0716 protein FxsA
MPILLLFFLAMPIVEMVILIKVGGSIGAINTVGLVVLTAVIGAWLLRREGLDTLLRANKRMETGEIPAQELFEGLALAAGGALLLTPGFVTDAIGFALLFPLSRRWLISKVALKAFAGGNAQVYYHQEIHRQGGSLDPEKGQHDVLEGEFRREE